MVVMLFSKRKSCAYSDAVKVKVIPVQAVEALRVVRG
jgi:hypothetical protein